MPVPDPSPDFVLALDFGGTKCDVATAALDGTVLLSQRLDTDAAHGAEQAVERALTTARELRDATTADTGGTLVAAGAASPGIVLDDRILLAPNVPGWHDLPLATRIRDGLDLDADRVVTATDVKAATLAEARWGALRDADPGVFLNVGTGLAAGIVVGGAVLGGANGAAGEIGYALRSTADAHGAFDGHAPLEEHAGGRAIGERGSALLRRPGLSAADVLASDDPTAQALVAEALDELAVHVANLAVLVDPARIAVGGGLMHSADRVLDALRARVRQAAPFPPEVVPARFVHDAALRGALALAIDTTNNVPTNAPITLIHRGGAAR
ncbi:MAG TPA: ROK family protein [Baekduia sp.]